MPVAKERKAPKELPDTSEDIEPGDEATDTEPTGGVVAAPLLDSSSTIEPIALGGAPTGGGADKFVDNNGAVIQVTQLFLVYWGSAWTATPPPTPTSAQITAVCQTMTASAYMT